MSLEITKKHLVQLLSDHDNKVIALSGKWGTGKSHLWREVKGASSDKKVEAALYVSLFGLASMDQVKLKIVQSSIPIAGESSVIWEGAKKTWSAASQLLESVHKSFGAINDLALLVVPALLKNQVIVLDDIERKHEKLSVDEVLGFIDEFTQQYGCRIIMILNSDQLADRPMWDKMREKVIDQEIQLETTPGEAFDIAITIVSTPYADLIKKTIQSCKVTNIRIICKVIKAVNRILGKKGGLSDKVLSRVVPSTVLLAATHYKGIDCGPDFEFILKIGSPDVSGDKGKKAKDLDGEGKLRAKWRLLLQEVGVNGCDEYENIVVNFLKSGLFDAADVEKVITRYAEEEVGTEALFLARQFAEHVEWHPNMSEAELLQESKVVAKNSSLLGASFVTYLYDLISGLHDGKVVADSLLKNWLDAFNSRDIENFAFDNFHHQSMHPDILAAFEDANSKAQAKTTLLDVCLKIVKNTGWGEREEKVLRTATAKDFELTIRNLVGQDLRIFMSKFIEMCINPEMYRQHFGFVADHFISACKNIYEDQAAPRYAWIIEKQFKEFGLEADLCQTTNVPGMVSESGSE